MAVFAAPPPPSPPDKPMKNLFYFIFVFIID